MEAVAIETEAQCARLVILTLDFFVEACALVIARVFCAGNTVITGGEVDAFIGDTQVFSAFIIVVTRRCTRIALTVVAFSFGAAVTFAWGTVCFEIDFTLPFDTRDFGTHVVPQLPTGIWEAVDILLAGTPLARGMDAAKVEYACV